MHGIDVYEENSQAITLEQFVREHNTLVKKIALHIKKRLPSHIELDDLLQSGYVGLLEAKNKFNPHHGVSFDTFASARIHGSIIDCLRKNSWGTRESMKNMRMINDAITIVEQRMQRHALPEEVAKQLNVSIDEYLTICHQISINQVINLDDNINELPEEESNNPTHMHEHAEILQQIKSMITTLPTRDQQILSLYYIEELTFKQIAEVLDLTEARICQLHCQVVAKLKSRLERTSHD